jgi:hypothetical protein
MMRAGSERSCHDLSVLIVPAIKVDHKEILRPPDKKEECWPQGSVPV